MAYKIFLFLIGFGLTIIGSMYIISYLNLLSIGYNFLEYVNFISKRIECLNALFGIIIMVISVNLKGTKNELCIWYLFRI